MWRLLKTLTRIAIDNKNLVNFGGFLEGIYTDVLSSIAYPVVSFQNCTHWHWHILQYLHNFKLAVTCCDPRQIIKPDTRNAFWWKCLPFKLACEKKKWIAEMTIFLLMSKMLKLKSDIALKLLWHFTIQKISLSSYDGKIKRNLRERIFSFKLHSHFCPLMFVFCSH